MQSSGNERWTALLGNWLIAVGCLRYRHVLRASPRRISMSTMHCFCWRGKQRANRQGFHFSVPTEFSSGWPWAQHWLDLYNQVPEKDRQHCGLCFDRRGRAWALSEVTRVAQEIFSDSMADTSQLKSYSFRRWGPTFGQALALSPMELNALGDWQARGETPRDAIMPLHREACNQGRKDLDRQVHRDIQNVWVRPLTPGEALSKFKLSKSMLAKAAALRSKGARASEARSMPSTLGDKVLSAFMRNGQALCGAFQIGRCSRTEQQCRGLHKCAVVLKSARVCGGRHPACECHDKRFLHAGDNKAAERVPKPEEVPQAAAPC